MLNDDEQFYMEREFTGHPRFRTRFSDWRDSADPDDLYDWEDDDPEYDYPGLDDQHDY